MRKVLLVGNCDYDAPRIQSFIESNFKTKVEDIKTMDEAMHKIETDKQDLILVNRIGDKDQRNGLELIDYMKNKNITTPIMLITNFQDKAEEAVEHGAIEGFGKEDIFGDNQESVIRILDPTLKD
jgi:DNA-binding NtrC family response regulator